MTAPTWGVQFICPQEVHDYDYFASWEDPTGFGIDPTRARVGHPESPCMPYIGPVDASPPPPQWRYRLVSTVLSTSNVYST